MENQRFPSPDRSVLGHQERSGRSICLKPLGEYLVEAGLIAPAQVTVALNDQTVTGLRFGEILANHGWVRAQTIEYFMDKVVEPERRLLRQSLATAQKSHAAQAAKVIPHRKGFLRSNQPAEVNKRPPAPPSARMPIAVSQPDAASTFRSAESGLGHRKHYGPAAKGMTPPPPPPPSSFPPPPPPEDCASAEEMTLTTCNGVSADHDFREASENLVWIG